MTVVVCGLLELNTSIDILQNADKSMLVLM